MPRARLLAYDGTVPKHPLLLAIKGRVLDVREGADYYGPDGPYKVMAGRDASKAFAMMSLKLEDASADLSGVPAENLKILDDWCARAHHPLPCSRAQPNFLFCFLRCHSRSMSSLSCTGMTS